MTRRELPGTEYTRRWYRHTNAAHVKEMEELLAVAKRALQEARTEAAAHVFDALARRATERAVALKDEQAHADHVIAVIKGETA